MEIPICEKCGKPTRRTCGNSQITLMYYQPIYDENGINTNPDMNVTTTEWECLGCGNKWNVKTRNGEVLREDSKGK